MSFTLNTVGTMGGFKSEECTVRFAFCKGSFESRLPGNWVVWDT